ncbi:MAG: Gfo/Idh/MocA family oxidoreductase [Verrucomicrobiales bacterium]|nr:Gfo/Idh/MocA family oxidoreductase [Verrucomicrobiales bacterium]
MKLPANLPPVHHSRRRFLRTSLAAAAGCSAAGCAPCRELPPSGRLHLAVVGLGDQGGGLHSPTWCGIPESRLVAVCDVHRGKVERTRAMADSSQGAGSCTGYYYFRELFARSDIDAVSIAVPDHWHALIALSAMRAGKHVYLEKPVAYTVAQGRALVAAARRYGVVLQNGTQQRSMPTFQQAAWLARSGRLGRVHTAIATSPYGRQGGDPKPAPPPAELDYEFWLGPAPWKPHSPGRADGHGGYGWYQILDYSGGWITAWGSHHVDCAQWGLGKDREAPVSVEATAEFPREGLFDTAWKWRSELTYADGRKLIFGTENESGGKMDVQIIGDEGWVCASRGGIDAHPKALLAERPGPEAEGWSKHHFRDFLQAIREGRDPAAPIEQAHLSTTLCHLTNISAQLGRPLRWDGAKERFLEDPAADRMLDVALRPPWKLDA